MINSSRNMRADLEMGVLEGTYIQLNPMRGGTFEPRTERLNWPNYVNAERFADWENPAIVMRELRREQRPPTGMYVVPEENPALG